MTVLAPLLMGAVPLIPAANPDYLETAWIVQADETQIGERNVRDGEYVLKHRLLPPTLAELDEDVKDAKSGKTLAKAGDQLFGLLTSGAPVFCVKSMPSQNIARSLLIGTGNQQRCLIDNDSDGRFDAEFHAGNAIPGLPNFMRKRPKKPDLVSGGAYRSIDPVLDKQNFFVAVRYEGRAGIIGKGSVPTFSVRFGTDGNVGSLTYDTVPDTGIMPFDVKMLSSRFTVLAREGEIIRVKVHEAMPEQRFGVVQTIRYN
ncbi:MAG TPA: hypothetical protein VFV06_07575 [Sphingorhabdus sp.]|nr:hypothetical protein [Sphingorhabdus sp.]